MSTSNHLNKDLLVRAIDDELPAAERIIAEEHLADCEECRQEFRRVGALSVRLEHVLAETPVSVSLDSRSRLQSALHQQAVTAAVPGKYAVWLRWALVTAAGLAATLMVMPRHPISPEHPGAKPVFASTFEIEGETFTALPYSNPELPANNSRVIQMQVPLASLARAGLIVEPSADSAAAGSVLADVLLGADGEPLGVHVLSED